MFEEIKEFGSDLKIVGNLVEESEPDHLQRTEDWLEARSGRWTGSKIKDLMGCGKSTSKLEWGKPEKLIDFGVTAEKYIYNVGMERLTGIRSMNISSKILQHGTDHEPLLIQQLLDDKVIANFRELGFETFPNYKWGGASIDGLCDYRKIDTGLETKCCVSWDGHYKRMYQEVSPKHDDFWQFQAEMLATGVKQLLYVVAMPMQVEKYNFGLVKASKEHQKCLLQRCEIADYAIGLWPKYGYKKALEIACSDYKHPD